MHINNKIVNIEEQYTCNIGVKAFDFKAEKDFFEYKSTEQKVAASSIKLFFASAVLEELKKNGGTIHNTLPVDPKQFVKGISILADLSIKEISIRDLLYLLFAHSDTTAQNTLQQIISQNEVNEYIQELGFKNTIFESNYTSTKTKLSLTTPSDTVSYMKKLWDKELHTQSECELLISFLQQSRMTHFGLRNLPVSFNKKNPIITKRYSKAGKVHDSINDTFVVETNNGTLGVSMFIDNLRTEEKFNSVDHEAVLLLSSIAESIFNDWYSSKTL